MRHTALLLASASVLAASPAAAEGPYVEIGGGVIFDVTGVGNEITTNGGNISISGTHQSYR